MSLARSCPALAVAVALLGAASLAAAEGPTKYTMDDLRALAETQSYAELMEHAEDVRPSERKAEWKGLLEKAAAGVVAGLLAQKKPAEALSAADQLRARFGLLQKAPAFVEQRGAAGLAVHAECMNDAHQVGRCVDGLESFVETEGNAPDLSRRAGKLLVEVARMRAPAAPFFVRATAADRAVCKDPSVAEAVLAAIGQPPSYETTRAAATIGFDHCWSVLEPILWEAFYRARRYESTNLCAGLVGRKAKLRPFQAAYCQDQKEK